MKLVSTSEAEIITDDEQASFILWSEKLMDEAFYLDPYQEKSFTYPILQVSIYDDDEVNENLGCDEEGNQINCSSFSPTELDIVVTLMYREKSLKMINEDANLLWPEPLECSG